MLPVGTGRGVLCNGDSYLCDVDYEISPPLTYVSEASVQHVRMIVHDYDCGDLPASAGLTLVLADGTRWRLPRLTNLVKEGHMECFLEADV